MFPPQALKPVATYDFEKPDSFLLRICTSVPRCFKKQTLATCTRLLSPLLWLCSLSSSSCAARACVMMKLSGQDTQSQSWRAGPWEMRIHNPGFRREKNVCTHRTLTIYKGLTQVLKYGNSPRTLSKFPPPQYKSLRGLAPSKRNPFGWPPWIVPNIPPRCEAR